MSIKAKLEALSKQREDAIAQGKQLLAEAEASEAGLTEDVQAQVDELTELASKADEQIQAFLDREKAIKAKLDVFDQFEDRSSAIASVRGVHVPDAPREPRADKIPARARRHQQLRAFAGDVGGRSAEERAYRFGQWAMAKLSLDLPGKYHFADAMQYSHDAFGTPLAVHGSGGSDTTGSDVFVPEEFGTDLIVLRERYGVARRLLEVVPMSSDTKTDPIQTGTLEAHAVGQGDAGVESDNTYGDVRLTVNDWMVLTRMSKQLDADSVINFGDRLANDISYAFAKKEDECAFNGDGTSTYHGITGLRTRLGSLTAGTAPGLIAGAGNAWSELTLANHEEVVGSLPEFADSPMARWVCHKKYYYTVMVRLILASGGTTATEVVNGRRMPMFLGYPVEYSQAFPNAEANSQVPVIFGDLMMSAKFGDRQQETVEFSTEASIGGQSLWERNQIGVKGTERYDIVVHSYGSNTEAGPVVGLETAAS